MSKKWTKIHQKDVVVLNKKIWIENCSKFNQKMETKCPKFDQKWNNVQISNDKRTAKMLKKFEQNKVKN